MKVPANPYWLLLRHELRLHLRTAVLRTASNAFLIISQVLLHLIALAIALAQGAGPSGAGPRPQAVAVMLASGLAAMLLLMTSRAMAGVVQSLYTRGDLDLLLASPVDRRAVIGVRFAAIALSVTLEVALLVWPFANVFVLFGWFEWLKAYLLVPAMAMLATSIGLALALACFRLIGPRRTRLVMQLAAVVVGVGLMLAVYLPGILNPSQGVAPGQQIGRGMRQLAGAGGWQELLLVPAGWLTEGYLPTVLFFGASAALLALAIHLAGDRVVATLAAIAGTAIRATRRAGASALRFRAGFRGIVVRKELRLLARDPFLVAQVLRQCLVALPVAFALSRMRGGDLPMAWLSLILLTAAVSGPLAWLTLLAEDAPDLLGSAPVSKAALVRAKIEAALLPVMPLCLLPLVLVAPRHPWFGACVSFCAAGAALTAALVNMRNPVARRRDSFRTRQRDGGLNGVLSAFLVVTWMLGCAALIWLGKRSGWA